MVNGARAWGVTGGWLVQHRRTIEPGSDKRGRVQPGGGRAGHTRNDGVFNCSAAVGKNGGGGQKNRDSGLIYLSEWAIAHEHCPAECEWDARHELLSRGCRSRRGLCTFSGAAG